MSRSDDEARISVTAMLVAWVRAVYADSPAPYRTGRDPIAARFVPAPLAAVARAFVPAWSRPRAAERALHVLSLGFADHVALRTAAIDATVAEAIAAGARQLVILGAGLDARAFRLDGLDAVTVFEIDRPGMQVVKRRRSEGVAPRARDVRFVPVDFEKDRLGDALGRAGFDPATQSVWIWEGVTVYLPHETIRATMNNIAELSAPHSRLMLTYATPDSLTRFPFTPALFAAAARIVGEPLRGVITTPAMHALSDAAGFDLRDDTTTPMWAERFWPHAVPHTVHAIEHLLVCERRGAQ